VDAPIRIENVLYFFVLRLSVSLFKKKNANVAFGTVIVILISTNILLYSIPTAPHARAAITELVPSDLFYIFMLGSLTRLTSDYIPLKPILMVPLLGLLFLINLYDHNVFQAIYYALLPYLLICVAFLTSKFVDRIPNDYSYSVYLWAFPIQQVLVLALPSINVIGLSLVSLAIVGMLSHLTWVYVENPTILLSKRLQDRISVSFAARNIA
jgi:peptidoglycan/LPS O-acetylase OafA/YrhL